MADWATNHEKLEDYKSIVVSKDHSMSERMNAVFHLRTINSADTHGPLIAGFDFMFVHATQMHFYFFFFSICGENGCGENRILHS